MDVLFRGNGEQLWFENSRGLAFSDIQGRKSMLSEDCVGDFDVVFCGNLNVVYMSQAGELVRLERRGRGWSKTVILKSRSGEKAFFGIRMISSEGRLNLIYGLKHNGENMIVHQLFSENRPQVVQTAFGEKFFVRRDETGCIYMFCEAAEDVWHLSVCRGGVWSRPEEIFSGGRLLDVFCTGYKTFCTVTEKQGALIFQNDSESFEVSGENPSIVQLDSGFAVIAKDSGQIYYTDRGGQHKIICSDYREFYVRLPESGEFALCDRCRGSVVQGKPRLFLIDNAKPAKNTFGESARLELTKQIIALEARVAQLEKQLADIEIRHQ